MGNSLITTPACELLITFRAHLNQKTKTNDINNIFLEKNVAQASWTVRDIFN